MKNILKYSVLSSLIIMIISCSDNDNANVSSVTYYPEFDVLGPNPMFVNGGTFTDPGVNVTENGEPIDYETTVSGDYQGGTSVDTSVPDRYTVTYTATNVDGFSGSASRVVWVYNTGDLVNSIEGLYTSTVVRNGSSSPQYTNMKYILIWKNTDGTYQISDAIGGYYEYGRGYGLGYAAQGMKITANNIASNDFTFNGPIGVGNFGGALDALEMTVNPAAKTITLTTDWSFGYVFVATLTQVQP